MGVLDRISALAGNVAKAKISFPKIASDHINKEESAHTGLAGVAEGISGVAGALASVDPTGIVAGAKQELDGLVFGTKTLTVQFNPASLNIDAYGGGRFPISNFSGSKGNAPGTIDFGPLAVYINISYTLIFDATDIADAFGADKFNLSAGALAKSAVSAVTTMVTGREYTVRPFVEGFLAAVRDPDHRTIVFEWGKLRYVGIMNRVDCKYTLFNPNGEPIRAEVQVNMLSESQPKETYVSETDEEGNVRPVVKHSGNDYLGYWTKRYTQIVEGKDALVGSTLKNVATNLLNL